MTPDEGASVSDGGSQETSSQGHATSRLHAKEPYVRSTSEHRHIGHEPGPGPRVVHALAVCSQLHPILIALAAVAALFLLLSLALLGLGATQFALLLLAGVALFCALLVSRFLRLRSLMQQGIQVKGTLTAVKPYGPLGGHMGFGHYQQISYEYQMEGQLRTASWLAENRQVGPFCPRVGDHIWLVVAGDRKHREFIWL